MIVVTMETVVTLQLLAVDNVKFSLTSAFVVPELMLTVTVAGFHHSDPQAI